MWFSLFYEVGMIVLFLIALPKALYECIRYGKHKTNFFKRLGFGFPKIERKNGGPLIWVHAVSVGECHAANPIVKRLKAEIPNSTIIVSSVSETGHEEAKKSITQADYHVYQPFDFYLTVRHVLKNLEVDLYILCEGDFWFRFLKEVKKQGAVTVVVNGKVSAASEAAFCRFRFITKHIFSQIDFVAVQSDLYKERFLKMGIAASKIKVTGNLKCDSLPTPIPEDEMAALRAKLELAPSDKVLVIGSTHDPEEEMLLGELIPVMNRHPNLKLIIAPRHPERFEPGGAKSRKTWPFLRHLDKGLKNPKSEGLLNRCHGRFTKVLPDCRHRHRSRQLYKQNRRTQHPRASSIRHSGSMRPLHVLSAPTYRVCKLLSSHSPSRYLSSGPNRRESSYPEKPCPISWQQRRNLRSCPSRGHPAHSGRDL